MKQTIKDLKAIIKIQERIIKANAASARTYKAELKVTIKVYNKAMNNWLSSLDLIAGLHEDRKNVWYQRNEAVRDYNAIHQLASYAAVPPLKHYDLPENMMLDPSKEYDFDVTSTVMESGKVKNKIIVFPKSQKKQDLKKKSKKRKNSYEKPRK
ncbi:MAG: hypothetical protein H8E55_27635 [Pelagibacterales bacterium]|nr:hypothetical protein [Pelagibacterales bacterium]